MFSSSSSLIRRWSSRQAVSSLSMLGNIPTQQQQCDPSRLVSKRQPDRRFFTTIAQKRTNNTILSKPPSLLSSTIRHSRPLSSIIGFSTMAASTVGVEPTSTPPSSAATTSNTLNADATATHRKMNMYTAINDALMIAMRSDDGAIVFGEDVAFGGVFRCTQNLLTEFGPSRVFNTPLSENGIVGLAIGYASTDGGTAIAEIQFADYIYPALDQIINELAKFRYRSGNQWNAGGVTIRTPCGAVGHGGHYHSQSPEAYLAHTPGIVTVMPSSPSTAKGLLLSSIRSRDPVIFLEPKILYRTAVEDVPIHDYEIPLGKARMIRSGNDITMIGYGGQVRIMEEVGQYVYDTYQISCDIIDLQTLVPYDLETMIRSVQQTGKCIVTHEAPQTCGYGSEIVALLQQHCFYSLQVPIQRVTGYDIPFPLITEKMYMPDRYKLIEAILQMMKDAK